MESSAKKAAFVRRMGKKRLRLAKGGRLKFDSGGLSGLIGSAGGMGGTGYDVTSGTNAQQVNNAYNQNQAALTTQGNVATALTPGANAAAATEATLGNQYAAQAAGQGPNVAQTMLNQETGQNIANQAALAAGQRGAGANVGLMERQVAQTGANTQQQAVGQGATLQAEQQIAAEQAGAQLANNQAAQAQAAANANTSATQGEQSILENANTANNQVQGQLANTTAGQQGNFLSGALNGIGGALGLSEGGEIESGDVLEHANRKLDFVHKMTKMGLEHHGPVKMAAGGATPPQAPALAVPTATYQAPTSNVATQGPMGAASFAQAPAQQQAKAKSASPMNPMAGATEIGPAGATDLTDLGAMTAAHGGHVARFLNGGPVKALLSPGEEYLSPDQVKKVVERGEDPAKVGKRVPGKAKVKGDSTKNDVVKADLEEGGVVVDREHMGSKDKRIKFVRRAIAKKKVGGKR